ncbi:MAG TPA: TPM domain-containing protein [Opitutaceae bacterium]|nr:TPM domain-containing protein [Opitutaceae bacterium]
MSAPAKKFAVDHDRIVAAIHAAELRTSGEIRVLVSRAVADEPVATAQKHFERLGMTRTRARNGVLIFVAPRSRTFAVVGDTGVHEKCGDAFWRELATAMERHFRAGDFTGGLVHGIECAGTLLAEHFPRSPDDCNELPDEVEETD